MPASKRRLVKNLTFFACLFICLYVVYSSLPVVEVVKTMPEEIKGETVEKKIQNIDGMKIETRFGEILFQFHPEAAPKTVAQMKKAVAEGYFNGCHFYRHAKHFVLQGGCWPFPNSKRTTLLTGGTVAAFRLFTHALAELPLLELEYKLHNVKYAVSMGRTSDPNTGSSEFAIMLENNTIVNGIRPPEYARDGRFD